MQYIPLNGTTGELKFYGNISQWWINGEDFARTLEEMAGKFTDIHMRVHCYGGSVFEGNVMANAIRRCKSKITVYIDGVSASMMAIVMQEADEVITADNGFVMVHCPSGAQEGNAKQFFQVANLLTEMEKNFIKSLKKKTKKSESDIKGWFDGNDHWFSAEQALEAGLVNKIEEPVVSNVVTMDMPTNNGEVEAVFGRFAALLTDEAPETDNKQKEDSNMKKELIAKFNLTGLTENSTDAEITAAIQAQLDTASKESKETKEAAIEAIIASAEKATGKAYEAGMRTNLVAVGTASGLSVLQSMLGLNAPDVDPAAAVTTQVAGAAGVPNVITMLTGGAAVTAADRKGWNWDKWQAEDQSGLEEMEKKDPEAFKALYFKEFGVTPSL